MQVVAKNINDYTRELKVDLTWEEVQPNFNKAAKAFSKKIKMPGFRPGRSSNGKVAKPISGQYRGRIYGCKFSKYYLAAVRREKINACE